MKTLLIEDESIHCEEYKKCIQYLPYEVELSIAEGLTRGIELTKSIQPDIIILDLELHESDGDGILFLVELRKMKLRSIPYVIIITSNPSRSTKRVAQGFGADYYISKMKPDYSPIFVLNFAHIVFENATIEDSGSAHDDEPALEKRIAQTIEKVGIPNGIFGRNYIIDAIAVILHLYENNVKPTSISLKKDVYPTIARKYERTVKNIEQSIRNAIKRAWQITDLDTLHENYTAQVNFNTGYPENRDFIFYFVDEINNGITGHD